MTRLTEHNWLDHGLRVLAKSGYANLKATTMAQDLGVSRGSFYWHFEDIHDFKRRLLGHWQRHTTDAIIAQMQSQDRDTQRLAELMIRAYSTNPHLDRAVRSWADHDAQVRKQLTKVDRLRLAYIRDLLLGAGIDAEEAATRARLIYAASLGDAAIAPKAAPPLSELDLQYLASILSQ